MSLASWYAEGERIRNPFNHRIITAATISQHPADHSLLRVAETLAGAGNSYSTVHSALDPPGTVRSKYGSQLKVR